MTTVIFSVASVFARAGVRISAVGRIDELARHTWLFIKKCLYSDSRSVSSVAQHAIYHARMFSPLGRHMLYCCERFNLRLSSFMALSDSGIVLIGL